MQDIVQNIKDWNEVVISRYVIVGSHKKVYMYIGIFHCIFWRSNTGTPTETIAILPNLPDT
jgi:hypothetical protein